MRTSRKLLTLIVIKAVVICLILLSVAAVVAFSVWEMFGGPHVWTGIFGVFTFLNVRAASYLLERNRALLAQKIE